MDREIMLVIVGGLIGAFSSIATIFVSYLIEGMRLRRHWQREDQLLMRRKREEIQQVLVGAQQEQATREQDSQVE